MRLVDTASEEVLWTTLGYYDHAFLWSPDGRYVGISVETRIAGTASILDTQDRSEITLPYVQELQQHASMETDVHEARPDPYFRIVEWLNNTRVLVSFEWMGLADKAYSGTYEYDMETGKLDAILIDAVEH